MFILLISSLAALAAANPLLVPANVQDGRIMGGQEVPIELFPYQVSLLYLREFFCGGSIISEEFVLTAAHCVTHIPDSLLEYVEVRAGSNVTNSGGSVHNVKKIILNDEFDVGVSVIGDSALLKVSPPFKFDKTRQPVTLADDDFEVKDKELAVTSGFGSLEDNGPLSDTLRAVSVPIVSWEDCRNIYARKGGILSPNVICAGFVLGEKDSCQGDSGGPLVYKGKQIGVVSWGYGCGIAGIPGVYESVAKSRPFIRKYALI